MFWLLLCVSLVTPLLHRNAQKVHLKSCLFLPLICMCVCLCMWTGISTYEHCYYKLFSIHSHIVYTITVYVSKMGYIQCCMYECVYKVFARGYTKQNKTHFAKDHMYTKYTQHTRVLNIVCLSMEMQRCECVLCVALFYFHLHSNTNMCK